MKTEMYELKLIYFSPQLNTIVTYEQEFDSIFELVEWFEQNIYDFRFSNQQIVQYIIAKKEVNKNG